jgi:hypothetical protein
MMVETHMLKPDKKRVEGTYTLLAEIIAIAEKHTDAIKEIREQARAQYTNATYYPLKWAVDSTRTSSLEFKGYEADTLVSEVTGLPRLKYDHSRPFTKPVTYYNYFVPADSVEIPQAYVVKKGWNRVMELLELNQIHYAVMETDTSFSVEAYRIEDYKTGPNPYEGHYPHYDTRTSTSTRTLKLKEGDYIIPTDQPGIRYILETLEPAAPDSFFNWNFFDTVLQQKEGFSPYVFEDIAADLLESDSLLQKEFLLKKQSDASFSSDWFGQLEWVYRHSGYYEPAHMHYPVYRILKP